MKKYDVERDESGNVYLVARYKIHAPELSQSGKTYKVAETEARFELTGFSMHGKPVSVSFIALIPA